MTRIERSYDTARFDDDEYSINFVTNNYRLYRNIKRYIEISVEAIEKEELGEVAEVE